MKLNYLFKKLGINLALNPLDLECIFYNIYMLRIYLIVKCALNGMVTKYNVLECWHCPKHSL